MTATAVWTAPLAFTATTESGATISMDSKADGLAPTPLEALLAAAAACTGMDVVSILEKKRQAVVRYEVDIEGTRAEEGVWPRPFTSIHVRHRIFGTDLDRVAVARAVELSDEKYCSVVSSLRENVTVSSEWMLEDIPVGTTVAGTGSRSAQE